MWETVERSECMRCGPEPSRIGEEQWVHRCSRAESRSFPRALGLLQPPGHSQPGSALRMLTPVRERSAIPMALSLEGSQVLKAQPPM